ncbi:phosphate/phosphite/phosphonate ABC transporter substrate-binding protein [Kaarinaea lacus]
MFNKILLSAFIFLAFIVTEAFAAKEEAAGFIDSIKELSGTPRKTYVFTAPPRAPLPREKETYEPIAEYLTKATSANWVYKHPSGWYAYQKDILHDQSHLFFDGAHFSSWRYNNTDHRVLAKLPNTMEWNVIVKKGSKFKATSNEAQMVKMLQGKKICLNNPPNFGTLTFLSHFKNPLRQPILVPAKGPKGIFKGLMMEDCVATVLPTTILAKFDKDRVKVRVIHTHKPYPNQAFTISPKVPKQIADEVQQALFNPAAKNPMAKLLQTYAKSGKLVKPTRNEYKIVSEVLDNSYGFGFNFDQAPGR